MQQLAWQLTDTYIHVIRTHSYTERLPYPLCMHRGLIAQDAFLHTTSEILLLKIRLPNNYPQCSYVPPQNGAPETCMFHACLSTFMRPNPESFVHEISSNNNIE